MSAIQSFIAERGHPKEWHCTAIDLSDPTGLQLMCVDFEDVHVEADFAANPLVQPLPHPLSHGQKPISSHHHKHLSKRFDAQPTDTVYDIAHKASVHNPCMKLTGFWGN